MSSGVALPFADRRLEMTTSREITALDSTYSTDARNRLSSPKSVVLDPTMTVDEKRSLLASWASDARAVPDHPALRRLDSGSAVEIDDILDALKQLDGPSATVATTSRNWSYRKGYWSRIGRLWRRSMDDDDDDGPTSPARVAPRRWRLLAQSGQFPTSNWFDISCFCQPPDLNDSSGTIRRSG
jgi:hypothetical protein